MYYSGKMMALAHSNKDPVHSLVKSIAQVKEFKGGTLATLASKIHNEGMRIKADRNMVMNVDNLMNQLLNPHCLGLYRSIEWTKRTEKPEKNHRSIEWTKRTEKPEKNRKDGGRDRTKN